LSKERIKTMENNEGIKVFDWDDELNDDGEGNIETVVLPDGTYPFEVVKVERQWYGGSERLPECNMAVLYLRVDGGKLGTGLAVENIHLCSKTEWKAAAFLRSIGLKKHGEPVKWSLIPGAVGQKGRAKILVNTYKKDGVDRQNNKVDKFFDKEEQEAQKTFTKGVF